MNLYLSYVKIVFKVVPSSQHYFSRSFSNLWIIDKYLSTSYGIEKTFWSYIQVCVIPFKVARQKYGNASWGYITMFFLTLLDQKIF